MTKNAKSTAKSQHSAAEKPPESGLIVGIGASAGGLSAFRSFLENMPTDSGMAFVLVQHLAPDHVSALADLLGKATAMRVVDAKDGAAVAANIVYVIPPNATLRIHGRKLVITQPAPPRDQRRPIDTFFSSLAEDQGENAVCIVLSGTGSDGTQGLKTIKEYGGFAMAQAETDHTAMVGMPHSAVSTGLVDEVLPVEIMPKRLMEYKSHLTGVRARKDGDGARRDLSGHLMTISGLLRSKVGHDFSGYKENTMTRRIQRRMQVLQIDEVPAYIARLRDDPAQIDLLFRDLLVGVTQFFRDPAVFEALEKLAIPKMLEGKGDNGLLRIWVPGCATGEEVYSIAILVKEALERCKRSLNVQIFGTDIDEAAITFARAGRYRKTAGVSPERLERWFAEDGEDFCLAKNVREMCVFSTHSVVKDPPFSKLDLISCRNLLIYMNTEFQDRAMRSFHYALKPGGVMLLGPSEGATRFSHAFTTLDKKHRLYQRHDTEVALPDLSSSAGTRTAAPHPAATANAPLSEDRIDRNARRALEKFSPVFVVANERDEILRFSGSEVGHYLEPSSGTASLSLFALLRKALRPIVRDAVHAVRNTQKTVVHEGVLLRVDGKDRSVTVIAAPLAQHGLCVIAFRDADIADASPKDGAQPHNAANADFMALEHELHTTKAQLQATIDELETINEEMKSAGEEYQSVNEELQSSNEELETAKEEMQSVNEELQTINAEIANKNTMLSRANSDLKNLLDSTEIATIFLDNDLRIKNFTPGMTEIFHLRDSDRGRPVTEIVSQLNYADLRKDVRNVLRNLSIVEREVRLSDEEMTFIMRIRPYRTVDNVIDGVVITFLDISDHKRVEMAVQASESRYRALFDAIDEGFCIIEKVKTGPGKPSDFRYVAANPAFAKQSGIGDVVGKTMREAFPGEAQEWFDIYDTVVKTGEVIRFQRRLETQNRLLELFAFPLEEMNHRQLGVIFSDISEQENSERYADLLMGELDHRVKNILAIISAVISQTLRRNLSPDAFAAAIEGRVAAVARTHNLMSQAGGTGETLLSDIINTELAPYAYGENKLSVAGPAIALAPKAGLTWALSIHELTTNAVKYGALSAGEGRLTVSWKIVAGEQNDTLNFAWIEEGGPAVQPPTHVGFGTTLIDRGLRLEFDAKVNREFPASGMRCTIDIPLLEEVGLQLSRKKGETRNDG